MGSVNDEITRIAGAKAAIEEAIEYCGVDVLDGSKIETYAERIMQIPAAVFSQFNSDEEGGEDEYIKSIKQENGVISATTGGLASSSSSGLMSAEQVNKLEALQIELDNLSLSALEYIDVILGGNLGNYGALTPAASRGNVYIVSSAGKINGVTVEVGDAFVCTADTVEAATNLNYTTIQRSWRVLNTNWTVDNKNATIGSKSTTIATIGGVNITANTVIYTIGSGDSNGQIKVTPSSGNAYNVNVKGLGDAAFCNLNYTTSEANRKYKIEKDSNSNLYTTIPWIAPHRTFTTGLQISSHDGPGTAYCALYVPHASKDTSGVVNLDAQSFYGLKTFHNGIKIGSSSADHSTDSTKIYFGDGKYTWIGEADLDDAITFNCGASKSFNFSWGNTKKLIISKSSIYPADSNKTSTTGISLGTSENRFTDGYFSAKVQSYGGFYETSDDRLKNFYNNVEIDLDKLAKLPKKYFTWKKGENDNLQIGTSAQAVQQLYPELVHTDENGTLSVAYDKLSVIALKGIDVLNDRIKSLEERLERLEKLMEK